MTIEKLNIEDALKRGQELPFAMIRSICGTTFGKTPKQTDMKELLEARYFSDSLEIRIFRRNGSLCAVELREAPGDRTIQKTYHIENGRFGNHLTVCYVLDADEDGQTFISATRLSGWKGELENA